MSSILLFSALGAFVMALIITPFASGKSNGNEEGNGVLSALVAIFAIVFVLAFIAIGIYYYVFNMDRNITSLWPFALVAAVLGTLFAQGMEQKAKTVLLAVAVAASAYILAAPLFNATEKFESVEMQEEVELEAFDETQTPASVPPQFARNKMKKAFGQVPDTSYYELGNLQIQKVNGDYVYIAPVEFSGFFKWWNADSTPGYFTMSATDASANPKFIKEEMIYTPSSYFGKNIERQMRSENPQAVFYGAPQLEVNEQGKPYYVRSYGDFISARNGFDVKGIVVVDPVTGESENYSLEEVPDYIDGAVSPESVSLENSYYGNYANGFWNSKFSKKDVKLPSDEGTEANVSPIFDEDGEMYYFTDFTSPKEGVDSMLGYSLTNARTGSSTFFTGSLEDS